MNLINENYFDVDANNYYMSTSQFKTFMECEALAMAELKGEYQREQTTSMLIGSYVDAHYDKTLDLFKAKNPEIFTLKGTLKAQFEHANYIIERTEKDEMFQKYMSGEKQVIITGHIEGIPFKTKIDSLHKNKAIVDLKVMKDFQQIWKDGLKISFVEAWGYDIQAAIYQTIEGNNLPFFICGVTKEKEPDIAIISIPQDRIDYCLQVVKEKVIRFDAIKKGKEEPVRCGKCDWCKRTKVITEIISYQDIGS